MDSKKTYSDSFENETLERYLSSARVKFIEAFEHSLKINSLLKEFNLTHKKFSYSLKRDSEDIKNRLKNY